MKSEKSSNNYLIVLSVVTAFSMTLFFSSCGGGGSDPEPPRVLATKNLTASPWKVVAVSVDGTDHTSLFTGLTITFGSGGTISATNGGLVWPTSGNWNFTDENATAFTRNDGITVQLTTLSETSLKMSLSWTKNTFGSGRVESISGQHVFTMGK